jgi:hypothetical protein
MAVVILGTISFVALLFVVILLGTLVGGIVGWTVDLMFPFVVVTLNTLTGLELTAFEMGAVLGFVGSFFKSSLTTKESGK